MNAATSLHQDLCKPSLDHGTHLHWAVINNVSEIKLKIVKRVAQINKFSVQIFYGLFYWEHPVITNNNQCSRTRSLHHYQESIFAKLLIFSKLSQNVMDQGAILSQQGMNPLYRDQTPSVFTVLIRQSSEPR